MARARHKRPLLSPVGHQVGGSSRTLAQDQPISVRTLGTVETLVVQANVTHPTSPYVVRFAREEAVAFDDVAIEALEVPSATHDLTIAPLELLVQLEHPRVFLPARRLERLRRPLAVVDFAVAEPLILAPLTRVPETTATPTQALEVFESDDLPTFASLVEEAQESPVPAQKTLIRQPFLTTRWVRTMATFMGIALAVGLPIHAISTFYRVSAAEDTIVNEGHQAIDALTAAASATSQKEFSFADETFSRASAHFTQAREELAQANAQVLGLAHVLPQTGRQLKQATRLLSAGTALADAARILAQGMDALTTRTTTSPTAAIGLFDVYLGEAIPHLHEAADALQDLRIADVPAAYRDQLREVKGVIGQIDTALTTLHTSSPQLRSLLGENRERRYLVLFQNQSELRPTGGFWGTLAEVDLLNGTLDHVQIPDTGTYFGQGQLKDAVAAPQPLQLLSARWELQDANWFPDFPTSAQQAMRLYEASGGPSVDGVIAVNASLVADLIDVTGPISLPEYGITVDGDTFLFQVQKQVELNYDRAANRPKAIIADMAPILIDRLTTAQGPELLALTQRISEGLAKRDIQIYHTDPAVQSALTDLGWTGALLGNTGDYLMVSHTNLGGGKTDGVIDDQIDVESTLRLDGRIENVVRITRTHHGLASSTFSGTNNVSFTRIFVPRGSTLLSVSGAQPPDADLFEDASNLPQDPLLQRIEPSHVDEGTGALVAESFGKTSFGQWMQVRPGMSSTLTFRYVLPADILQETPATGWQQITQLLGAPAITKHSMQIQMQPGVEQRHTHYTFASNNELQPVWTTQETSLTLDVDQNTDAFFGVILER